MLACILFVFGALTEYACLLFGRGWEDESLDEPVMVNEHDLTEELDASDKLFGDMRYDTPVWYKQQIWSNFI